MGVGESWDFVGLDRGAKILPPFRGAEASDWYKGNADAVYQNLNYVRDHDASVVLILSGDHIYTMDYRELIRFHLESGADMTVAFKRMGFHERFGYGRLNAEGRLIGYEEKPAHPSSDLASLTIYVVNARPLADILSQLAGRPQVEFGQDVVPLMIEKYRVMGYVFNGYWAYTRTVAAYYHAHQDLLAGRIDLGAWGVRTNLQDTQVTAQPPPRFRPSAQVSHSFFSDGCDIHGTVVGSVLSPGVRVEKGARVINSIIFHRCVVERGATINLSIVDKRASIGADAQVGPPAADPPEPPGFPLRQPVTLLGKQCRIAPEARVPAGAEVPPEAVRVG